jgi:hypothetical protein
VRDGSVSTLDMQADDNEPGGGCSDTGAGHSSGAGAGHHSGRASRAAHGDAAADDDVAADDETCAASAAGLRALRDELRARAAAFNRLAVRYDCGCAELSARLEAVHGGGDRGGKDNGAAAAPGERRAMLVRQGLPWPAPHILGWASETDGGSGNGVASARERPARRWQGSSGDEDSDDGDARRDASGGGAPGRGVLAGGATTVATTAAASAAAAAATAADGAGDARAPLQQLLGGVELLLHAPSKQPSRRRLYLTRDGSQINLSAVSGISTARLRPADVRACVEEGNATVGFAQSREVPRDAGRCLTLGASGAGGSGRKQQRVHLECRTVEERDRLLRGIRAWLASRPGGAR